MRETSNKDDQLVNDNVVVGVGVLFVDDLKEVIAAALDGVLLSLKHLHCVGRPTVGRHDALQRRDMDYALHAMHLKLQTFSIRFCLNPPTLTCWRLPSSAILSFSQL